MAIISMALTNMVIVLAAADDCRRRQIHLSAYHAVRILGQGNRQVSQINDAPWEMKKVANVKASRLKERLERKKSAAGLRHPLVADEHRTWRNQTWFFQSHEQRLDTCITPTFP